MNSAFEQARMMEDGAAADTGGVRNVYTDKEIIEITDFARRFNVPAAKRNWDKHHPDRPVAERTVRKYLEHLKAQKGYFSPSKRGAKGLLNADQLARLQKGAQGWRAKHKHLSSSIFCAMARGIFRRDNTHLTALNVDGLHVFTNSWGRTQMDSMGFRVRKATTDRTVTPEVVVTEGAGAFYEALSKLSHIPRFATFNFDEFFTTMDENVKWTWERIDKGENRVISIRQEKAGFTTSVLCSADGVIHLLQAIFQGKTSRVEVCDVDHPKLLQQHREDSHFQNGVTFAEWARRFVDIANKIRKDKDYDGPVLLIMDQAPQHSLTAEEKETSDAIPVEQLFEQHNILVVKVPKNCTHVFQPCDQYVIAGMKQKAKAYWYAKIADMFAQYDIDKATEEAATRSTKFRRKYKLEALVYGIDHMHASQVIKSWEVSGIIRAMWNDGNKYADVAYDRYVAAFEAEQQTVEFETLDSESDDEEVDLSPAKKARVEPEVHSLPVPEGFQEVSGKYLLHVPPPARGRPKKEIDPKEAIKLKHLAEKRRVSYFSRFVRRCVLDQIDE